MLDQIKIGNKASFDDFEATVKYRTNNKPKKKSIKETVPFSNLTYDFSAINGELYWEERTLEYVFEIMASSAEELENKKKLFNAWVMNIMGEELYDPFIKDYHFIATFDDIDDDDSEVEKSTITVTFTAYPYMIANKKTEYSMSISSTQKVLEVVSDSSHKIVPTLTFNIPVTLEYNGGTYSMEAGEVVSDTFMLEAGLNTMKVKASSNGTGTFKVSFYNEVF